MSKQAEGLKTASLLEGAKAKVQAQLKLDRDSTTAATATRVHPVAASTLDSFLQALNQPSAAAWASINKFKAKSGEVLLLPSEQGAVSAALLGVGESYDDMWAYAALPGKLPAGTYDLVLPGAAGAAAADKALLGWMLGTESCMLRQLLLLLPAHWRSTGCSRAQPISVEDAIWVRCCLWSGSAEHASSLCAGSHIRQLCFSAIHMHALCNTCPRKFCA
jgi:hypothetical protein